MGARRLSCELVRARDALQDSPIKPAFMSTEANVLVRQVRAYSDFGLPNPSMPRWGRSAAAVARYAAVEAAAARVPRVRA